MTQSRREFLVTAAAAGTITVLPFAGRATGVSDLFDTPAGTITVHPVGHASFVMETPAGVIHVDPVGGAERFAGLPDPDLILITHRHGDHYDAETLAAFAGAEIVTNADVLGMMSGEVAARAQALGHDGAVEREGLTIEAIPAFNTSAGRESFHPRDRGDNGYVLSFEGFRVYVSGDTEDIPEMRALEGIDLAFLCMNLPFTMTAEAAADAVQAFRPSFVYPYHYRGRDDGTQDPQAFAEMVGAASDVKLVDWYPGNDAV